MSSLPKETQIGHVRLQVADLGQALAFYRDLLGFQQASENGSGVALSATSKPPYHVVLAERAGAHAKPRGTTGLYHVAIRYPSQLELARTFERLVSQRWPFQGFADHWVSEALYLADPDGNGVELYVDRPRSQWRRQGGQIAMATEPLDVEALLAQAAAEPKPWSGVHPETDIGHVHLQVSDLSEAEAFYQGLLGFEVTQRGYPGALFLAAGGYHHHVGVNVWAGVGAPPPPPGSTGLLSFALRLPDRASWNEVLARVEEAGVEVEASHEYQDAESVLVRDASQNGVELLVGKGPTAKQI
jgi:catechol 2,3-dioxygenase